MIIIVIAILTLLLVMLVVVKSPIIYRSLDKGQRYEMSEEEVAQLFKDLEPQFYTYDSTGKVIKEYISTENCETHASNGQLKTTPDNTTRVAITETDKAARPSGNVKAVSAGIEEDARF